MSEFERKKGTGGSATSRRTRLDRSGERVAPKNRGGAGKKRYGTLAPDQARRPRPSALSARRARSDAARRHRPLRALHEAHQYGRSEHSDASYRRADVLRKQLMALGKMLSRDAPGGARGR